MSRNEQTHEQASWVRERHASPVASLYFSDLNVDTLQDALRYGVYRRTSRVIARQSTSDLIVTMRARYLADAVNRPDDVVGQVRSLNEKVLKFCVDRIVTELGAREKYLVDMTQDGYADTLQHMGRATSIKGNRSLELKPRHG